MKLVLLYIPVPDLETGRRLAEEAVMKRWAACANLLAPVESLYEWEGSVMREEERVLLLKTTEEKAEEASRMLEERHPYDCPCILRISADANASFAEWVGKGLG